MTVGTSAANNRSRRSARGAAAAGRELRRLQHRGLEQGEGLEEGLGPHPLLGKGEALTDGREKNSILADATEALIAAIYMDGGFDAAFGFVENQFRERLRCANRKRYETDHKSMLQERVQATHHDVPQYTVVDERGPDHDKTFSVRVSVAGISAEGEGKSKKMAEQEAARAGLDLLDRSA